MELGKLDGWSSNGITFMESTIPNMHPCFIVPIPGSTGNEAADTLDGITVHFMFKTRNCS